MTKNFKGECFKALDDAFYIIYIVCARMKIAGYTDDKIETYLAVLNDKWSGLQDCENEEEIRRYIANVRGGGNDCGWN